MEKKTANIWFATFSPQNVTSLDKRDAGLDGKI